MIGRLKFAPASEIAPVQVQLELVARLLNALIRALRSARKS